MTKHIIIKGDCLEVLKDLPRECIDLVLTSPPYGLSREYSLYSDKVAEDDVTFNEYLHMLDAAWRGCYRVLKESGKIAVNIGDQNKGNIRRATHIYLMQQLEHLNMAYRELIVWDKLQCKRRTTWGSFMSPSSPFTIPTFEYIIIYSKGRAPHKGDKALIDITKEEFIKYSLSPWRFKPAV